MHAERVVIPMSCSSEGAVDVYIEPRVPLRRLVVVGFTPVAEALAELAATLDYDVVRVVVENELRDMASPPRAAGAVTSARVVELGGLTAFLDALDDVALRGLTAIVASQGHYDELALEVLLTRPIAFAGLLASRRRAATVLGVLAQQGLPADRLATVHNPVGLDIGARSPGEVAVSILAEIIAAGPTGGQTELQAGGDIAQPGSTGADFPARTTAGAATAVDPVCGMDVETAGALYRSEYAGTAYFFCCVHCRATFTADPQPYLLALGNP